MSLYDIDWVELEKQHPHEFAILAQCDDLVVPVEAYVLEPVVSPCVASFDTYHSECGRTLTRHD
jgi:hypothetical protein